MHYALCTTTTIIKNKEQEVDEQIMQKYNGMMLKPEWPQKQAASQWSKTVDSHTIWGVGATFVVFSYFWCKI